MRTSFTTGTIVTSSFLNAINNGPVFDGQELDGHRSRILNSELSTQPGQILNEWTSFKDELKVIAGTGLNVTYNSGIVTLMNGTKQTISAGTVALADNATNYLYIDTTGTVISSTTQPIVSCQLARVTTVSGAISGSVVDMRHRFVIFPRPEIIRIFGGNGSQGDYSLSGTATLDQGEFYYKNFTVQSGASLTIAKGAKIHVSGNANIAGTINVLKAVEGGSTFSTNVVGNIGGLSGGGAGPGSGSGVSGGDTYNYLVSPVGSGGGSGFCANDQNSDASSPGAGGKGGGCLIIEAAGSITISGSIFSKGGPGGDGITSGGSASGGGGGSGGLILLKSLSSIIVSSGATLDVSGGDGGDGVTSGAGGGGGGAGQIVLISPNVNTAPSTLVLDGGSAGTSAGGGSLGGGCGGGFGGTGGGSNLPGSPSTAIIRNFLPQ